KGALYKDSIDKVINHIMKGKKKKISEMINDSTGRSIEISKRSGKVVLLCLKSVTDTAAVEIHFYYHESKLLRARCEIWNLREKHVTFDSYYFKDGRCIYGFPDVDIRGKFVSYLIDRSLELYTWAEEQGYE